MPSGLLWAALLAGCAATLVPLLTTHSISGCAEMLWGPGRLGSALASTVGLVGAGNGLLLLLGVTATTIEAGGGGRRPARPPRLWVARRLIRQAHVRGVTTNRTVTAFPAFMRWGALVRNLDPGGTVDRRAVTAPSARSATEAASTAGA